MRMVQNSHGADNRRARLTRAATSLNFASIKHSATRGARTTGRNGNTSTVATSRFGATERQLIPLVPARCQTVRSRILVGPGI